MAAAAVSKAQKAAAGAVQEGVIRSDVFELSAASAAAVRRLLQVR
jgi:hypothetical protein